jgi:hypothetical protein
MTVAERARRLLATRRWLIYVALAAAVCTAPSLGAGLAFDDYFFEVVLRRLPMTLPQRGPLDLFRFADGNAATARALMDEGVFAWTSDPSARNAFLRPLSALTHVLDYAAWPGSPALMHAQSIAWYVVAVLGAAVVYRRLLGAAWVAGLAALLYAVDDAHGPAVTWLANRNAFVAAALGLPVVWLHDRWRRDRWSPGGWLGPLLFATALFAGESAIAVAAYIVAYALHVDRGTVKARLGAVLPYAGVVALWRAVYSGLGYGVYGSDLYLDPAREPALFLAALPRRYLANILGQLAIPRADFAEIYELVSPSLPLVMALWAVVALGGIAVVLRRLWKSDPLVRFFATGMLLAAIPINATMPGGRLFAFVGLGAMGLLARFMELAKTRAEIGLARGFFLIHVVLAPLLLAAGTVTVGFSVPQGATDRAVPRTPDVVSKTVVLVNPPADAYAAALVATRLARGEPRPASVVPLAGVLTAVDVTRVDERTLRVRPEGGFLAHSVDRNWRSLEHPLAKGSVVELSAMTATVTGQTPDGRPAEAELRFHVPLEDPSLVWRWWTRGGYAEWAPPRVGETVHLRGNGFREALEDMHENNAKR